MKDTKKTTKIESTVMYAELMIVTTIKFFKESNGRTENKLSYKISISLTLWRILYEFGNLK